MSDDIEPAARAERVREILQRIETVVLQGEDGITKDVLHSRTRTYHVSMLRGFVIHIGIKLGVSPMEAGAYFDRDRTTAIYASESVADLIETEKRTRAHVERIESMFLQTYGPDRIEAITT